MTDHVLQSHKVNDLFDFAKSDAGEKIASRARLVIPAHTTSLGIVEVEKNIGPETVDYKFFRNIARSAEHLVAFDLLQRGIDTFVAAEGLPYDLVANIGGGLRRVQVKSTQQADRPVSGYSYEVYRFKTRHRSLQRYREDADLFAFVAIDRKLIFYQRTIRFVGTEFRLKASRFTEFHCRLSWRSSTHDWLEKKEE
jgi:hypothetical protein